MTVTRINPTQLYNSLQFGFSHAALQEGGRTLHLAGQVGWDANAQIVGPGDLAVQTRQALANLKMVLAEVGATPADLVRIRTYIVDHDMEKLGIFTGELMAFYGDVVPAPNTVVGVQALALPDFLVEIEATAIVPK